MNNIAKILRFLQNCARMISGDDSVFEYYLTAGSCHLKYAQGRPAVTGREFHSYDEIVLFLAGNAQLISENIQLPLTPGSIVLIPKEQFHQFVVTDSQQYIRCILGFEEIPHLQELIRQTMTEVTVFPDPSEQMLSIFQTLIQASREKLTPQEQTALLQSAVAQLLLGQKLSGGESIHKYVTVSALTQKALQYIDSHLSEELRLDTMAQALGISVSSLCHRFRKEVSISVYRYISEKRLSMVRRCVQQGMALGAAAEFCGFKDYSGFFRLYKSYYGEIPSAVVRTTTDRLR